jgi:DNA repair exonuclease SbcCD ATPase subunit
MAFTVKDFEDLLRILDRYPHWREELRRRILLEELEQLPRAHRRLSVRMGRIEKALAALAETVRKMAQDQRRHATALTKLRKEVAEARAEADRRFAELAEAQRRTEESLAAHRAETERRFAELAEAQRRHYEEFAVHRQEFLEHRAETERRFAELAEAQRRHYEEFAVHRQEFLEHREELLAYRAETDRRFAELAEAQRRTEESLAAHRAETERRFAELAEALRRLVERVDRIEQDVGTLKDHDLRRRYAELAPSYFGGPNFRKVHVLTPSELVNRLLAALDEGKIEREDFEEARRIDLVVRGEWEGRTLHLALETSWTIDRRDVERAVRRARILQAILGETWPAVAGSRLTEGARELLQQIREEGQAIVVAQDGGIEWPS